MQLDRLVQRHPGWQDVRQLDAMISHISSLPRTAAPSVAVLPQARLPQKLQRRPLLPTAIAAESKRIQAVQYPARQRVERLRGSTNVRIDRAVSAREQELRSTTNAELKQAEADLREESRRDRVGVESRWYVPIRDLWLKEFALETQVTTYKPYPASPAYKTSVDRLAEIHADRLKAEQDLAVELQAVDARLQQRLANVRNEIESKFTRQIAAYRSELEQRASTEMGERLATMQAVLGRLEPLERPKVPPAPDIQGLEIPSPGQVAAAVPSAAQADVNTAAQVEALKSQRDRLAAYLNKDVKRRLDRLARQFRWRVTYDPQPGLDNITDSAARLLTEEWTP